MKIIIINCGELKKIPPVINLINCLLNNGHTVKLITKDYDGIVNSFEGAFSYYLINNLKKQNVVGKIFEYLRMRKYINSIIDAYDLIWTTTDMSVFRVGKVLLKYKHVMQLMELVERVPISAKFRFIHFDIEKYARRAFKVVVPEYNRAHIQKVLWDLKNLPIVLPNKPYELFKEKNENFPDGIKGIVEQMKNEKRKIILYQGVFGSDRNLDIVAEAVSKKAQEYCLYIMGKETEYSRRLCTKYPDIIKIPRLNAPSHLSVTRHADIGVLAYVAKECCHYHILNALYCAPNKIFEYAGYGLPMIGTNVVGLDIPFKEFNMGYTYENNVESVLEALSKIEENYDEMSKNAHRFYESVDLDKIVTSIIEDGK